MLSQIIQAQPSGNIRGIVTDGASGQRLSYVSVVALNTNPSVGTISDSMGYFRLNNLPIGRYDILSSFLGYEPAVSKEIMVSSGKETFLEIIMQENIQELKEVTVRPKVNKETPLNTMALASVRMFSVEEASRYAGGFDDPARLETAFAGVSGGMSSNGISIRGNAPLFLQWRLEGVEAVNPTHFSDIMGVGGGIFTALSSQMLGNSDFFTGAFPAEYGNALSGVFDMQLRNGNNYKHEHTAQIGTLGVEFASEGPFKKDKDEARLVSTYLFNYRYSSMALAADLFPELLAGAGGIRYQDLSFKLNFPTRQAGTFSVWGVGLIDHFLQIPPKDTLDWIDIFEGDGDFKQTKVVGGLGHKIFINEKTLLKSALVANYTQYHTVYDYVFTDKSKYPAGDMKNTNWNATFSTYLNMKFNAAHTNRTGITVTGLFYDLDYNVCQNVMQYPPEPVANYAKGNGNSIATSAFSQSLLRLNSRLTANIGIHGQYFHLIEKVTVEPRIGIRWQALPKHTFGIAYGKHSRREQTDYYFMKTDPTSEGFVNKDLDFAKAHHLVLSYDWSVSEHLRLKVEPYFQYLYDVPVEKESQISLINYRDFFQYIHWENGGKGKNYGVDVTLERYLHQGYYYLLTASLFESLYTIGDDVWRNTRLNRNYIINALGGKEWNMGKQKQNILGVSLRFTLQGGERYTPLNETESKIEKRIVLYDSRAYELQSAPEFITHFTVSYTMNRNKLSHEIAFKIFNVTGVEEFDGYYYNYRRDCPELYNGAIVIPNVSYKINF